MMTMNKNNVMEGKILPTNNALFDLDVVEYGIILGFWIAHRMQKNPYSILSLLEQHILLMEEHVEKLMTIMIFLILPQCLCSFKLTLLREGCVIACARNST